MSEVKVPCGGFKLGQGLNIDGDTLDIKGAKVLPILTEFDKTSLKERVSDKSKYNYDSIKDLIHDSDVFVIINIERFPDNDIVFKSVSYLSGTANDSTYGLCFIFNSGTDIGNVSGGESGNITFISYQQYLTPTNEIVSVSKNYKISNVNIQISDT